MLRLVPAVSKSKLIIRGALAPIGVFALVRFAFWPAQLAHSPYRDATLGSDLLTQFFLDIPVAAWLVGSVASVLVFVLVTRWLRSKER